MSNSAISHYHTINAMNYNDWTSINTQLQSVHEDTVDTENQKISERALTTLWKQSHSYHEPQVKVSIKKGKTITKTKRNRKTMSETVREAFAKDKLGYFGNQSKIDDFIRDLGSGTLQSDILPLTLRKGGQLLPGNILFTRDEWIHIVKQTKLRFPELHRKGKQTLKRVTSQMQLVKSIGSPSTQTKDNDNTNDDDSNADRASMWSQASTCPDEELTPSELRWLYDLPDTHPCSDNEQVSVDDESFHNDFPYLCTLSQAMKQSHDVDIILDSEPEPEPLKLADFNQSVASFRFDDSLRFKEVRDSFIGERQVKDSFTGGSLVKDSFIGGPFVKDSFKEMPDEFKTPTKKLVSINPESVTSTIYSTAASTLTTPQSGKGIDQILGILEDSSEEVKEEESNSGDDFLPSSFSDVVLQRAERPQNLERKSYRIVTVRTPLKIKDYDNKEMHIKVRNVVPKQLEANDHKEEYDDEEEEEDVINDSQDEEEANISIIEITRELEPRPHQHPQSTPSPPPLPTTASTRTTVGVGVFQVPSSTNSSPIKPALSSIYSSINSGDY
ncbi:5'-flap endonuclease [Scheffersomyces spartinae]|uniref:5'-flap endonuclease n=1 Tax=Scheffersomyces spartinae TaxID=45513 RepID=A0A9P7V9C4_9ASCO|nr:5'-flap endonuclease [Scheffersomyces spartinae]KAG7193698.1 5'-flap endonuclease [Scheffersomyces spartinae]